MCLTLAVLLSALVMMASGGGLNCLKEVTGPKTTYSIGLTTVSTAQVNGSIVV